MSCMSSLCNKCYWGPAETTDHYVANLSKTAKPCAYGILKEELIRDRLVIGTKDKGMQMRLLQKSLLALFKAIDIGRASEQTLMQMQTLHPLEAEWMHSVNNNSFTLPQMPSQKGLIDFIMDTMDTVATSIVLASVQHLASSAEAAGGKIRMLEFVITQSRITQPATRHRWAIRIPQQFQCRCSLRTWRQNST